MRYGDAGPLGRQEVANFLRDYRPPDLATFLTAAIEARDREVVEAFSKDVYAIANKLAKFGDETAWRPEVVTN